MKNFYLIESIYYLTNNFEMLSINPLNDEFVNIIKNNWTFDFVIE